MKRLHLFLMVAVLVLFAHENAMGTNYYVSGYRDPVSGLEWVTPADFVGEGIVEVSVYRSRLLKPCLQ